MRFSFLNFRFGAGLLKGVVVTGLINSANNGITIGKR